MNLSQALGYKENDRLLIINADDYGMSYSVNQAIQQMLVKGSISSATLMLPCAWAREGAIWSADHPQYDVGIHFTFTSEWESYKWGPVTRNGDVTSLVTEEGYFHADCLAFEQSASPSQVQLELNSQVEMALQLGVKPTHADNHMGSLYGLQTGKHYLLETLDVCAYYGLPFRLPRFVHPAQQQVVSEQYAEQVKQLAEIADQKGVVILDYLIGLPFGLQQGETLATYEQDVKRFIEQLPVGVTELIIHPSLLTEELKSFHREPQKRQLEYEMFYSENIQSWLQEQDVKLVHWSQLQQLQRTKSGRQYPY